MYNRLKISFLLLEILRVYFCIFGEQFPVHEILRALIISFFVGDLSTLSVPGLILQAWVEVMDRLSIQKPMHLCYVVKTLATFPSPAGMSLAGKKLIIPFQGEFFLMTSRLGRENG
jgi:hypothetical protein